MKKNIFISSIIALSIALLLSFNASAEEGGGEGSRAVRSSRSNVSSVGSKLYKTQCSECHFAYPPGFLPSQTWKKIMAGLADHFGDNAELMPKDYPIIMNYLVRNGGQNIRALQSSSMRITDTPYFRRLHNEVSPRRVKNDPKIGTFSNCTACHRGI